MAVTRDRYTIGLTLPTAADRAIAYTDSVLGTATGEDPRVAARRREAEKNDRMTASIAESLAYRGNEGQRSVAGFVMEAPQTLAKMQAKLSAGGGDYLAAKEYYDTFNRIVRDNVNDIARLTRKDVAESGDLGQELAKRANLLLSGDYVNRKVTMADGSESTLGVVFSDDGGYEKFKRQSLSAAGFSPGVADLYFGGNDLYRAAISTVVDPVVTAAAAKDTPVDPLQNAALADYLSHRDADGNYDILDRLRSAYGDAFVPMLKKVRAVHEASGDYARAVDNLLVAGEHMRRDGESQTALASRVMRDYTNLACNTFAGLAGQNTGHPEYTPDNQNIFDATFSKYVVEMDRRNMPVDLSAPATVAAFRRLAGQNAWAERLDLDLTASASDSGNSYTDAAAAYIVDSLSGVSSVGNLVAGVDAVRNGLSNVTGSSVSTARYTDRTPGANKIQATLGVSSGSSGLDGVAFTFQKFMAGELIPKVMAGGDVSAEMQNMFGSQYAAGDTAKRMADMMKRSLPGMSGKGRAMVSDILLRSFAASGGTALSVADAVSAALTSGEADTADPDAAREVRSWLAANSVSTEEQQNWQQALAAYYKSQYPSGSDDLIYGRVANDMARIQSAVMYGGMSPEQMLDEIVSRRKFYATRPVVIDGKKTVNPVTRRDYEVIEVYDDIRRPYRGKSWDEIMSDQARLESIYRQDQQLQMVFAQARARAEARPSKDGGPGDNPSEL